MNFNMEYVIDSSPALVLAMAPSTRIIRLSDEKLLLMLPFVPRVVLIEEGVRSVVIPGEYFEALLNDEIILDDEILIGEPIFWACPRFKLEVFQGTLLAAVKGGLKIQPYATPWDFITAVRDSICRLPLESRPRAKRADLEESALPDFTKTPCKSFLALRWFEEMSIQEICSLDTGKTRGWGILVFVCHPCLESDKRYTTDSAFGSVVS